MRKITLADIRNIAEYEKIRDEFRRAIIELKKRRRVQVGDIVTFVFENRETVLFQIQEMMRAERLVHEEEIQREIDIYNELIPGDNELSATMLIEIDDLDVLRQWLPKLVGIEEQIWLRIGDQPAIRALYEPGRSKEDKTSTVHYVRFRLSPEEIRAFRDESLPAVLAITHENYRAEATIPIAVRRSLMEDLAFPEASGS
ncbi:MAG: DUF3501 family protein [Blastocatellia bacterium]|nr:DUF3501 family protein [Blastocatellia bacterium]MCS7158167.1 DUF3501 family protein [Blastocatellia bacterium]MCX7752970.1 DUF3501 family protein [Blastocatellia bacterium]MDW8168493.1 DUF3501 family protein [Acidobacteriota bacterium]MDW8256907.1 DUF3501 family protein [Acidobacteriota bacterium]